IDYIIIAILTLTVSLLLFDRFRPHRTLNGPAEKSIAVLPFENMTQDKENEFFADGIQDDILTSLSKISDLKVISRTSTMPYRGNKESRNLRQIGEALGVDNILEGSVRRADAQVAVTVQLLDARTDRHIWANRYDRTISNTLTLQGELAEEIARALKAKLSPEEKVRVETKPTDNAEAYLLFLRARELEQKPDTLLEDLLAAEKLVTEALALDPKFALAYALRARVRAYIFHFHQATDSWKNKARADADEALRLQPNGSETHFALGLCYYWLESDYERALAQFATAAELSPNDTKVPFFVAAIRRRQGQWQEALDLYHQVEKLDPQNPNVVRNILFTNTALRNWEEAAHASERMGKIAPASLGTRIQAAYVDFWGNGTTKSLQDLLGTIPAGTDPDGAVTAARWDVAMINRDFVAAETVLRESHVDEVSYLNGELTPKDLLFGLLFLTKGDTAAAQPFLEAARKRLENASHEAPESAERHANLGLLYAFTGQKDSAIAEGRKAVELKPESKDAFDGAIMNCCLALIYTRVGETNQALELLERLGQTPGAVDSTLYSVTASDLRYRFSWDPLRNEPRFQHLLGITK
ncbi:MAG: tetratricopeptide repeat protein, partial [Verrucomicrobiota bacterium]|nr:tetratricopeptide repeat protein [Verrucomicrobiota bacterium]